jgi:predicted enzyme related to lactoylglutathione lyase
MADEKILMVTMAVTDMAKAKAFYAEQLGWSVTTDVGQGDQHWVTLEPPGGGASLTLSTMHGNMKPGTMRLYLSTSNIEAATCMARALASSGLTSVIPMATCGRWLSLSTGRDSRLRLGGRSSFP